MTPIKITVQQSKLEEIWEILAQIANPQVPFYLRDKERGYQECIAKMQQQAHAALDIMNTNRMTPPPSPGMRF